LIIEGVLRLGQFTTANAPSGTEGALYFNTADKAIKVYSDTTWTDLGGGWDGILPNYTTAQRNALSLVDGLIVYNTTDNAMQIYASGVWRSVGAKLSDGVLCTSDADCDSTHCVDGYCCNFTCDGNCNRCNVAGSIGACTDVASDCTGNCDVCSAGNCAASVSLCTGNCDTCSGSGTAYSCVASDSLCTGNCDVCSGSGTAYSCAASNALCSNTTASCSCSGSGTVFNCSSCPDTYGLCGYPTCSSYTCGNVPENGVACATCKTCSSGTCSIFVANGLTGLNCTATHYRCNGSGGCTAPCGANVNQVGGYITTYGGTAASICASYCSCVNWSSNCLGGGGTWGTSTNCNENMCCGNTGWTCFVTCKSWMY